MTPLPMQSGRGMRRGDDRPGFRVRQRVSARAVARVLAMILGVATCAAPGYAAGAPAAQAAGTSLVDTALAREHIFPAEIDAIYNAAILKDGNVGPTAWELESLSVDSARPLRERSNALLVASHLEWRFGKLPEAADAIRKAAEIERSPDVLLHKARIDEAAGNLAAARSEYEESLQALSDPELIEEVRLRLVFLSSDADAVRALVDLARTRDRAFRNRAAVALAILNHPGEAAGLYEVYADGPEGQRQHLRLAQWALQARQARRAQDESWEAVRSATLSRDLRYSLSVMVEAHELDASWDRALERLSSLDSPDARSTRVEILRRLGRYGEAIALLEAGGRDAMTPDNERRLLRMYSDSGKSAELVAQFRKLIDSDPAAVAWPRGLSEHFLEQGRSEDAVKIWRDFIARNESVDVLLEGGETMDKLGLADVALEAADRCLSVHPDSALRIAWFRFEHYLGRGQMGKAEDVLAELDRTLPPGANERMEVADAYERIKNPARALAIWQGLAARPEGIGVDEKMRMAWLYDTVGERDKALGIWRNLWENEVPEARRRLVEDRMLALAAETGTLGDIAIDLEQRLSQGKAEPKDSSLLIRIYTEIGDSASAIEVIQEYYGKREQTRASEIASLKEQARVYQSLNRHAAFIAVTSKLLELDPANRIDYLQSLVLTLIERGGKEDREQLEQRLAELRQASPTADEEFEAGVLVMAGMRDRAIDTYRKAIARNPSHSDNYLVLADLLKKNQKDAQALAMLQYFAEIAPTDDGFMIAVDGILNLRPQPDSPVLRWAQRRVIERLARRDDKFYLYDLSAEIADEARDTAGYLASLEDSLVEAGPRRSTVLRELIAATGEKEDEMPGSGPSTTDYRRNLTYSRRLISLGDELPPDVYLNLGRTFLRLGRPDEALAAFNMAIDRTDRPSLVEDAADRFESAGYTSEAVVLYEKALTGDPGSVSLMAKLARVRHRQSGPDLAKGLYLRALLKLASQQLVEADSGKRETRRSSGPDESFTFLFRRYFSMLEGGLLYTMNGGDEKEGELPPALAEIGEGFEAALREVALRVPGTPAKPLGSYPRLSAVSKLAREVALSSGYYDFADSLDRKLLRLFGGDAAAVKEIVDGRLDYGLRSSAEKLRTADGVKLEIQADLAAETSQPLALEPLVDLKAAARDAIAQRKFDQAVDIALAAGDPALAYSFYQEWLATSAAAPTPAPRRGRVPAGAMPAIVIGGGGLMPLGAGPAAAGGAANLARIAAHARDRLDPEKYGALCRQIAAVAASNPELASGLLTSGRGGFLMRFEPTESPLIALEQAAGRKLFTPQQLSAAVAAIDTRRLASLDLNYVMARLGDEDRAALFMRFGQSIQTAFQARTLITAFSLLLERPVPAGMAERVAGVVKEKLKMAAKEPFALRYLATQSPGNAAENPPVMDPANVGLVAELDRSVSESLPEYFAPGTFRNLVAPSAKSGPAPSEILAGVLREATQVDPGMPATFTQFRVRSYLQNYVSTIYPGKRAELLALLDSKIAESGLTSPLFWIKQSIYEADPAPAARDEMTEWLERVVKEHSDHRLALETLATIYRSRHDSEKERRILEMLVSVNPDAEAPRRQLAALWHTLDHPENEMKALGALRARAGDGSGSGSRPFLFGYGSPQVEKYVKILSGKPSTEMGQGALRGILQLLPPPGGQMQMYQLMQSGIPVLNSAAILSLRFDPPRSDEESEPAARWLKWIASDRAVAGEPGSPVSLLDSIAKEPYALPELESVVRVLDPSEADSGDQYRFYSLLADSIVASGKLRPEFDRLSSRVASGKAGRKELLIWMELASRLPVSEARDLPAIAEKALLDSSEIGGYQRLQLAHLCARAGQVEKAVSIYCVAAVSGSDDSSAQFAMRGQTSLFTAIGLFKDAVGYLDVDGLALYAGRLAEIFRPHGSAALDREYARFLTWLADAAMDAGVPRDRLRSVPAKLENEGLSREELIRWASVRARLVPAGEAVGALREALKPLPPPAPATMVRVDPNTARYAAMLGIQGRQMFNLFRGDEPVSNRDLFALKLAFPTRGDSWEGASDWVRAAAAAIPRWVDDGSIEADIGVQALSVVTLRLHQMNLPEVTDACASLSKILARSEGCSTQSATLAVAVADEVGSPVDLDVIGRLVAARRVDVRQLAGIVRRAAEVKGAASALALGEAALDYTRNDGLLREMEDLARRSGDPARAREFAGLREHADVVRAALQGKASDSGNLRLTSVSP